ncbi:LAME_0C01464g1_1 [Lachancea meyersii CBS 8951]|uniref:LSM2-LSM8 complex subunit LSM8 n=1 Tax=Lachancea meyersii CBS 8951 TaxID=1266667 RepID=A0A1G4IZ31_9SACH|nr:LAME_0C01464g1_1 [Lachancea meyersii CBS 8951]
MSPLLKDFLNKRIVVITTEGQCVCATLEGFDNSTNLLISQVKNRVSGEKIASSYVLRGNQVVCCGLLEDSANPELDLASLGVAPLKDTRNYVPNEHVVWQHVWAKKQQQTLHTSSDTNT